MARYGKNVCKNSIILTISLCFSRIMVMDIKSLIDIKILIVLDNSADLEPVTLKYPEARP
jgi:hypothetical protein